MGELIMFRPQKGPLCKIRAPDDQAGAQIVFFTGVRYQRMSEDTPTQQATDYDAPPAGGLGGAGNRRRRRRG